MVINKDKLLQEAIGILLAKHAKSGNRRKLHRRI